MTEMTTTDGGPGTDNPAALRIAIIASSGPDGDVGVDRSALLARQLEEAGHDVLLVAWARREPAGGPTREPARRGLPTGPGRPRTIRALSWTRPDSWVRTGRRLRHVDSIIVMNLTPALVPVHLAVLRAAGALAGRSGPRPQSIVLSLPARARRPAWPGRGSRSRELLQVLLRHADATVVPDAEQAHVARGLGAQRVTVATIPDRTTRPRPHGPVGSDPLPPPGLPGPVGSGPPPPGLSGPVGSDALYAPDLTPRPREPVDDDAEESLLDGAWARCLGLIEALSVDPATLVPHPADRWRPGALDMLGRGRLVLTDRGRRIRAAARTRRAPLTLLPEQLPDWVHPTDVLADRAEADVAWRLARLLGLPRTLDRVGAWSALGALTAILRIRDDGRRGAVIADEGGGRSVLSRWARAVGFAPVGLGFTGAHPSVPTMDVDAGSLDVVARIDPAGCDAADIDAVLDQAAWALRVGGLLIVTLPLGPPSAEGTLSPADVRAAAARAHRAGFVLVGDLDGRLTGRMREAATRARAGNAAYGLVRLTLRRR